MSSLMTAKVCPRKAAIKLSPGASKSGKMKVGIIDLLKEYFSVRRGSYFLTKKKPVIDQSIFNGSEMFNFEAEAELNRAKLLVERMMDYLRNMNYTTVKMWFTGSMEFLGKSHDCTVHALWDCGDHYKAVQFKYSSPRMSYRTKKDENRPDHSFTLYKLQRVGEKVIEKLKLDDKPVFGCIYYLKSKEDKATNLRAFFEEKSGWNIIDFHFGPREIKELEAYYANTAPNINQPVCDKRTCSECIYQDLCELEFTPRKLQETEEKEERNIQTIRLTKAQEKFVDFNNGVCRCVACAGTGKTTIITLRTLALIEEGCPPEKILMITFTDKAKGEMKERLRKYARGALKDENLPVDKVVVETFNSWGQGLLEQHYAALGFQMPPKVVDDVLKKDIILEILDKHRSLPADYRNPFMNLPTAVGVVPKIVSIFDAMKAAHVETLDECKAVLDRMFLPHAAEVLTMYQEYNAALIQNNQIDYEDQLRLILKLQEEGRLSNLGYVHIVVDEFQDSNKNQIDLILQIMKQNLTVKSLAVVGDEMQAIYGFRSATPDNIINFNQYFSQVTDICLEDNFRSETPIIARANQILRRESAINKQIKCHSKAPGIEPAILTFSNTDDEINLYVRQIAKLIKDGTKPSDIAVLARTRGELIKYQEALSTANIPSILKVPDVIGNNPFVKAIIGLAEFIQDNSNTLGLALYAKSIGLDPFDNAEVEKLGKEILDNLQNMNEAEKILYFYDLTKPHAEDYIANVFLEKIKARAPKTLFEIGIFCTKYKKYDIKETHTTAREDAEAVNLITVHSAKGLEWDTVLLSIKKFRDDPEERRLLYVAVTRAKRRLLVTADPKQYLLLGLIEKEP